MIDFAIKLFPLFVLIPLALLVLKLIEMVKCIYWVVRANDSILERWSTESIPIQTILEKEGFPFFPGNTPSTSWIGRIYRSGKNSKRMVSWIFRYPYLMIICSLLVVVQSSKSIQIVTCGTLFLGVWTKAVHLLAYRYRFGAADNIMLSLSIPDMTRTLTADPVSVLGMRNFVKIFISTFVTTTVSYAAIYYAFANNMIVNNSLENIQPSQSLFIQALYFSTATICTVGFGDILAQGSIVRLVATSEMMLSVILLVIFVTAFSSTANLPKD